MKFAVTIVAVAGLALASCNRDDITDEQFNRMAVENGASTELPPAPNSVQGFANAVANANKFEIAMSQIADINSSASPATKAFATEMIGAHKAATVRLRVALAQLNPPPMAVAELSDDQQAMLDTLRPKRGAEFDAAFKAMQIAAHEKALAALQNYTARGDTPALVDYAKALVPVISAHLEKARALD